MVDDGRHSYNPGDRNRDGLDDDIDRRLGNENDSVSYASRYDRSSEQEFTNLPEPHRLLSSKIEEEQEQRAREAMSAAQQDVHFFPDVGKFIIPAENSWAAHADLVLNNDMRLHFNPDKYFFDKIIADRLNIPALTDKSHPDFAKYKGLRTNLEVLRNDIIGQYLDDGGFDKGDEAYIPAIKGIAETLANALANDVWWKRPFVNFFSQDVANVEAVGAAEMYKFLLKQQDGPSQIFTNFTRGVRQFMGTPDKNWGLLTLEKSPFSPEGLAAPPPHLSSLTSAPAPAAQVAQDVADKRVMESLSLINQVNNQFKPIENIVESDKEAAVEDGRTILRWLRNLQGTDRDVQDFLSAGSIAEQTAKAEALSGIVKLYANQVQQSAHLHGDVQVKEGGDAAGGAAMMIAEHAMSMLPPGSPAHVLLASAIDTMPENYYERSTQSVARLLDHMELGLAKMSGQQMGGRTTIDRLVNASDRVYLHAMQLHSLDSLTQPKREESVELGREILRKLRGMMFSDKPIAEQMDTARPEEKAALIEKIEEMVEIYRNILADALVVNPALADDQRIKDANDAVGGMTHGIKLMASKDIPASVAQAQQISADVTQMPDQWKNLSDRAADRLLDTMEGALEAAVESLEQADQQQQKDAELAQEAIEASLMQSHNHHNKRRRRRAQKSGMTAKKQQQLNRDFTMDDAAAGQGRFANQGEKKEENKQPSGKEEAGSKSQNMDSTRTSSESHRTDSSPRSSRRNSNMLNNNTSQARRDNAGGRQTRSSGSGAVQSSVRKDERNALNLSATDLAAIKSLGSALRGAGQQANALPMAEVKIGDPTKGDDKSAAERAIDQALQARRNNNHRGT